MSEQKVLIVAYYWPPSGGSGVQRWLKFVKYLPQFGWQPYVFTPENPSFEVKDNSLLNDVPEEAEVIHFPIWEPYELFNKLSSVFGSKPKEKGVVLPGSGTGLFGKISTWIRGNFFIPDPRRFWIRPSVNFLIDFLKDNNIDTIITTGPPHSMHLIGYELKKKNKSLRWIADFRDPWSEWGFLDSIKVSKPVRNIHKKIERQVLQSADVVTTITPFYVKHFEKLGGRKVELLTNGFDEDDFKNIRHERSDKFMIRHVGIVNEKCDPRPFLSALEELAEENIDFGEAVSLEFIGQVHQQIISFVENKDTLRRIVHFINRVPHKELLNMYGSSSLLLLVLTGYKDAEGYMPGKLFEYIATGIPVLGVGTEEGDAAALLNQVHAGKMIHESKKTEIKQFLLKQYNQWKQNPSYEINPQISTISRRAITEQLIKLIKNE